MAHLTPVRTDGVDDVLARFARAYPELSARDGLAPWQKVAPVVLLAATVATFVLSPFWGAVVVLTAANLAYPLNGVFKLVAGLAGRRGAQRPSELLAEDALPTYAVLLPMYDEPNMVAGIVGALAASDYPKDRLDVLLLLEEDDTATRRAAAVAGLPHWARVVVVPDGTPRTKPRACTYGLEFARGDYVVIYDAEDRPDPDQLRMAATAFAVDREGRKGRRLGCVQAALNYHNPRVNLLTRLFSIEYAFWFNAMIPGMVRLGLPIPLGGTSNHFPTAVLREVGAWDPYNVTEDADLGMRLDAAGYRTGMIDSTTWEEACSQAGPWIRQRTRWIKGYLVTAAVHLRRPARIGLATAGIPGQARDDEEGIRPTRPIGLATARIPEQARDDEEGIRPTRPIGPPQQARDDEEAMQPTTRVGSPQQSCDDEEGVAVVPANAGIPAARPTIQGTRLLDRLRALPCLLLLILGTPAVFLAYPVSLAFSVVTFVNVRELALHLPGWLITVGLVNMVVVMLLTVLAHALTARRTYGWRIAGYALLLPVYWTLHAIAAWRGLAGRHRPVPLGEDAARSGRAGVGCRRPRTGAGGPRMTTENS